MEEVEEEVKPSVKPLRLIKDDGTIDFSDFIPRQKKFIFTNDYMLVDAGGLGSGKTAEACALALFMTVTIPKNRWWICRLTGDKLEQSTMKEFFSLMGCTAKNAMQHPLVKYWNQTKRELVFQNGSEVKFVSLVSEDSARGPSLGGFVVDQLEEISELTLMDLDARCRLPTIPKSAWRSVLILNPAPGWCKRTFLDRNGGFKEFTFFESTTKDLTKIVGSAYMDRLLSNRPQWWIDRFVWGKWGSAEGAVFHKFKRENNTITRSDFNKKFRQTWPVIGAYDHGSNSSHPCAILFQTWDPEKPDTFYIFSGAKKNENVDDFAKTIKELRAQFAANPLLKIAADLDTFGQRGIGTPAAAYAVHGIGLDKCRKKPNYLTEAIAGVNTVFAEKKIYIVSDLLDVLDEMEGWEYKPKPNGLLDSAPSSINDDYCKSLLYLFLENQVDYADVNIVSSHNRVEYTDEMLYDAVNNAGIDPITGW